MIYILPLLISLLIYIVYEDINFIIYGIITLLIEMLWLPINIEILIIIYLILLILYFLIGIYENKTLIMLGAFFIIGSYLSIISTSMISLFISIEVLSFTIIIIINLYIQDQYPGIIYYLISGIFTGLFILSLGYLYLGYIWAEKLIYIVFLFKLGLIPFHLLLPMIYLNLSPINIFIIDIPYKLVLFYILIKLDMNYYSYWYIIFILIISTISSLRYKNLILIMIYSSIFNYALILILISLKNNLIFLYYIFYYSIFVLIYLYLLTNYFINKQFSSSFYFYFWLILFFNLLGIPPLSGFYIKYYTLYLIIENNLFILFIISIISILLISYTYLRILNTLYMNNHKYLIINKNSSYSHLISFLLTFISFPLFF